MANPQVENGFIQISTELAKAFQSLDLKNCESKVLWTVICKTYGWHKTSDKISLSQFCKETKLPQKSVCRAISSLVSKMTLVVKKDGTKGTTYSIQKDYEKWNPPLVSKLTHVKNDTRTSDNLCIQLVSKLTHTKDTLQKITKDMSIRKKPRIEKQSDSEFITMLKTNYTWVDIDKELIDMDTWISLHPGRKKTRQFIFNWIKKIDKPLPPEEEHGKGW
jgi:phage replication O-like protein O